MNGPDTDILAVDLQVDLTAETVQIPDLILNKCSSKSGGT